MKKKTHADSKISSNKSYDKSYVYASRCKHIYRSGRIAFAPLLGKSNPSFSPRSYISFAPQGYISLAPQGYILFAPQGYISFAPKNKNFICSISQIIQVFLMISGTEVKFISYSVHFLKIFQN